MTNVHCAVDMLSYSESTPNLKSDLLLQGVLALSPPWAAGSIWQFVAKQLEKTGKMTVLGSTRSSEYFAQMTTKRR